MMSVGVLLAGVLTAALAISSRNSKAGEPTTTEAAKGFTMISTQIYTPTGGTPILGAVKIRYQWPNGDWKQVTTYYNREGDVANTDSGFGVVGRGVFQVNKEKGLRNFLSGFSNPTPSMSEEMLRQDPEFVREEVVLGFKTFVSRLQQSDSEYTETHRNPGFGDASLKTLFASRHGIEVIEPLAIYVGEPNKYLLDSLPDYPINYDAFKKKIEVTEQQGRPDVAEQMRAQLRSMQQTPPRQ